MKCDKHEGNDSNKCLNSKGSAPTIPLPPQYKSIEANMSSVQLTSGNKTLPKCNLINSQRTDATLAILSQTLSSQKLNVVNWAFIPRNPLHSIKIPADHKHKWKTDKTQIPYLLIHPLLEEKQILNTAQST
jgi:hypothetical protein